MSDPRALVFVPTKGRHVIMNDPGRGSAFRAHDMHARVAFRVRPNPRGAGLAAPAEALTA